MSLVSTTIFHNFMGLQNTLFHSNVSDFVGVTYHHSKKDIPKTFYVDVFNMIAVALYVIYFVLSQTLHILLN